MVLFGLSLKNSYPLFRGFSAGKESACKAGDLGSILGLGRSPREGDSWLPIPVFWPRDFHGLYSPGSHKDSDTTKWLSLWLSFILNQWFSILGDVAPQGTFGNVWIYFFKKIFKYLFVCAISCSTQALPCVMWDLLLPSCSVACGGLCSPARDWNLHCKVVSQPWTIWVVPGYIFDSHNLEE